MNTPADYKYWGEPLNLRFQALTYPIVLIACFTVLAIALNICTERMPDPTVERPLPDLGEVLIPKISALAPVTDALLGTLNVLAIFTVFKLYLLHRYAAQVEESAAEKWLSLHLPWLHRVLFSVWEGNSDAASDPHSRINCHLMAWIRFFVTFSILSLFRAPVILLTSMPATDNKCQHPPTIVDPFENVLLTLVTMGSGSIHCGDLMFSGHTVNATLACCCLWVYGPMVWWVLRPLGMALLSTAWFTIISSRSHYTDDVVVAVYLTVATFWLIPHNDRDGAPLSLQLVIRWMPYASLRDEPEDEAGTHDRASITVSTRPPSPSATTPMELKDTISVITVASAVSQSISAECCENTNSHSVRSSMDMNDDVELAKTTSGAHLVQS